MKNEKPPIEQSYEAIIKPENVILNKVAQGGNERARGYLNSQNDVLGADCRISIDNFRAVRDPQKIEKDLQLIQNFEKENLPDFTLDSVIEHYRGTYGNDFSVEELKNLVLRDNEKKHGVLAEKAVTALLFKFLPKNYLVARTNKHDDYNNHFDNIIINLETGEVVCGFDEVYYDENRPIDKDLVDRKVKQERVEDKKTKMKNLNRTGVMAKYCYRMEDGKLKPSSVQNLPVFYLGLSKDDLFTLLNKMKDDSFLDRDPDQDEVSIMKKMAGLIIEQKAELEKMMVKDPEAISKPVRKNIRKLDNFFKLLESYKNV